MVMAIVVRFVDYSSVIQKRLQLLVKYMTGEEIARELINMFSVQYTIGSYLLVAVIHDRAVCDMVALRTLS